MSDEKFDETEERLLDAVSGALADGVKLLEWWQEKDAKKEPERAYAHYYKETKTLNRPDDKSYGFFDEVALSEGTVPINGNVQEMFYDDAKAVTGERKAEEKANLREISTKLMHDQLRSFIVNYFMRVSDFRQPELAESNGKDSKGDAEVSGFGFEQVFYKRRGSDKIGRFKKGERNKIVALSEFAEDEDRKRKDGFRPYEWIVLKNPIFGFGFNFKLFGNLFDSLIGVSGPEVKLPAKVFNYLVMSPDFVVNESIPDKDIIGRYGFGYAFVNDPEPSVYGYGPGQLQPAFEQMVWEVDKKGVIKVRAAFVAEEPREILQLSVDPLAWGFQFTKALGGEVPAFLQPIKQAWDRLPLTNTTFDPVLPTVRLANLLTMGGAEQLGLSKDQIIKEALFIHFQQHYQTIVGSLQTWRQIKDWTQEDLLPKWVVSGKSS